MHEDSWLLWISFGSALLLGFYEEFAEAVEEDACYILVLAVSSDLQSEVSVLPLLDHDENEAGHA